MISSAMGGIWRFLFCSAMGWWALRIGSFLIYRLCEKFNIAGERRFDEDPSAHYSRPSRDCINEGFC